MDIEKNNRKKLERILIIGVLAIFVVVSVTYAFFQAQLGDGASADVDLSSDTTDSLKFSVSGPISLNINQFNFGVGAGNLDSNATATATLLANNNTKTATFNYYVYFRINSNEYVYTTSDSKPEIILTVTDPEGNPVTSIDGLTYVPNVETTTSDGSTQTVSGFDITTETGTFAVASAYSITADSTTPTVQEWDFTATFINLDSDQQANTGKAMDAEILIQKNLLLTKVTEICASGDNLASCIAEFNTLAGDGADNLYYHDADLTNGAQDNSYRYSGVNPNNYVCFGATGADCQNVDNQYRIIGVFNNQIKLIKAKSIGDYAWEADWNTQGNTWDANTKPDIYRTLNTTYWNTLGSNWQGLIDQTHIWQVGGFSLLGLRTVKQLYDVEIRNQTGYEETMAVGLMYVSDYGYGANPSKWSLVLSSSSRNYGINNWLCLGNSEWLISRQAHAGEVGGAAIAYFVGSSSNVVGDLYSNTVNYTLAVRPVFYLSPSVELIGGSGSSSNPYTLNLG